MLLLAVAVLGATPAHAGKTLKPGLRPEVGKQPFELDPGQQPTQPPPPPPQKGWPNLIQTGSDVNCQREPGPREVIVYRDGNFAGNCAVLAPGFYPFAANFLVGNDAISSVKVGSAVRARVFKDPVYAGEWNIYVPGTRTAGIGGFNDKISSMRVEPADRSANCDDLRDGEIALYENSSFRGDCVVLPGEGSYANAETMGIENDSISSIRNSSGKRMDTFWDPSFSRGSQQLPPHSEIKQLSQGGFMTNGIDDDISSIQML